MIELEYSIAKLLGVLKRDKNKETINQWFIKKGVHLPVGGGNVHINSNIAKK